jgi:DNA modification methylase
MAIAEFYTGEALKVLSNLCKSPRNLGRYRLVVTSPPYYGHRHYGTNKAELGHESDPQFYVDKLTLIFTKIRDLLTEDGTLWIVIGDTRRQGSKLMIPHRLAMSLVNCGYFFKDDIIWYKKNFISGGSSNNLSQAYEYVLFFSNHKDCYTNINGIRTLGNEVLEAKNKKPPADLLQFKSYGQDRAKVAEIRSKISNADADTPFSSLPTTDEISLAFGYDPEKYCPTCYRKFKRHATRKRIGDHKHYPIFAVCNPLGKNPGNVWEISTKAHHGNEHFAIYPEDLVENIVKYCTKQSDWVMDPFMGRGTTGIVCSSLGRNFAGIDLYQKNVLLSKTNIQGKNYSIGDQAIA